MSITVNDHRKYAEGKLADSIKAAEEKVAAQKLLAQEPSELANTGDEHLDKLIRAVEDLRITCDTHLTEVATQSIHLVQAEPILASKCEYFYTKGQRDAYLKVAKIPAQILVESKPTPLRSV